MNTPMNNPTDKEILERLKGFTFYRLLDNEEVKAGDLSPSVLACGPCLYPEPVDGGIAEKHHDVLRPFDIAPIIDRTLTAEASLAAAQERVGELVQELAKEKWSEQLQSESDNETIRQAGLELTQAQATISTQAAEIAHLKFQLKASDHGLAEDQSAMERMEKALKEIARYDSGDGCCTYGCDCPTIAQMALTQPQPEGQSHE